MKDAMELLKLIVDFLNELSEEDISALLDKRARLKVDFPNQKKPTRTASKLSDSFFQKFDLLKTREEAQALFEQCAFRRPDLQEIAAHYKIPITGKKTNVEIIDQIIASIIGFKLDRETMLNTDIHRSE